MPSVSSLRSRACSMVIMGNHVDMVERRIAIPHDKKGEIVQAVEDFSTKTFMTKRKLQSLLGKLLYINKIIQPARGFLNRMLQTLRKMQGRRMRINSDFKKDLYWFKWFLQDFNGCTSFDNWAGQSDVECHVDASLTGLGAICGRQFYSVLLPQHMRSSERIVVYEMINVLIALRMWGNSWVNKRVTIYCDNHAVVDVIGGNKTRDSELGAILREILMLQARANVHLKVLHVRGEVNVIADKLSRIHMDKCEECILELCSKGHERVYVGEDCFKIDKVNL